MPPARFPGISPGKSKFICFEPPGSSIAATATGMSVGISSLTERPGGTVGGLEVSLALISPRRNSVVLAVVRDWEKSWPKSPVRSRTEPSPPIAQSFQSGTTRWLTTLPIIDLIGGQYFVRRTFAFISDDSGWQNSEGQ